MVVGQRSVVEEMSRYAFIVTSAINTKFGVYSSEQRLAQTLDTIKSIKDRVSDPLIIVLEVAGVPLTEYQRAALTDNCNHLIDFTADPNVVGLYASDNWDVVKNVTEVLCFGNALRMLNADVGMFKGVDRIFKVSGRYVLTDDFDITYYDAYNIKPFVVIGPDQESQFPYQVTQVKRQYMARLWSWPTSLTDEVIGVYTNSLNYMYERLAAGGYADIEHVLYKFLDPEKLIQKPILGVKGNIAPNGVPISN